MQCRKCNRKMGLAEFLTYAETYLLKLIAAAAVPFLVLAIKELLSNLTRGIIDESMAGLANNFKIVCPNCKKYTCWDPAPEEEEPKELKQKNENNENVIT